MDKVKEFFRGFFFGIGAAFGYILAESLIRMY